MKTTGKAAIIFAILVACYLLLGLLAYLMPDASVRHHVEQSIAQGDLGEDYPKAIIQADYGTQDQYTMDNFTDALIINQAVNLRSEGVKSILLLPRHDEGIFQCNNLRHFMAGTDEGWTIHYARYWHGSTFLARILLTLTSYSGIRYLLFLFSSVVLLWCLMRLWRTVGRMSLVAVAAALLLVNVYVMQFSLQFVPVLLIALGGILWLTYHPSCKAGLLFFALGSLTAFADLITVPTLTLGLPLVVLVAVRRESDWRRGLLLVVQVALWWLTGYVLTWLSKWGLATLLTGENIFADAYGQGTYWGEGGSSYIGEAISSNLKYLHWKFVVVALAVLAVLAAVRYRSKGWALSVQYLLVALIPFAYYVLMAHPAQHHAWYNYRALATAVAALLMAGATMVDWNRVAILKKFRSWIASKNEIK